MNTLAKCRIILWAVLLLTMASSAQTNVFPLLKVGDVVYKNAKIDSVTPKDVLVFHDEGAVRIAFSNLPIYIQKQYGYDPAAAQAFDAKLSADKKAKQEASKRAAAAKAVQDPVGQIEISYDKFTDVTNYATWPPIQTGGIKLTASTLATSGLARGDKVNLRFVSESEDWKFLDYRPLVILYDGKRKTIRDLDHDGSVFDSGVAEYMNCDLAWDEFSDIASAKSVEARLGIYELKLDYASRASWRAFVKYFQPESTEKDKAPN